ncbi:MAG: heparan-alpha-glucosaminide N-acetyltransferase domain-containing protein, partial [Pseudomonadota bacterium]
MHTRPRLDGLDLARFLAFVGMVLVNFAIVMGAPTDGSLVFTALQGKAAATFVVLAGIGLGLASPNVSPTIKRGMFLLVVGLANTLIFEADILHYYGVYFIIAAAVVTASTRSLVLAILAVNMAFLALLFVLDYEAGWNWTNYTYAGFWTPEGFVRNLFFNGWHPVLPWIGFIFFGMALARLPLHERATQHRLIAWGLAILAVVTTLSAGLTNTTSDEDLRAMLDTSPLPPTLPYTLAGMASATFVIGACIRWSDRLGAALRMIAP